MFELLTTDNKRSSEKELVQMTPRNKEVESLRR